jgi:hypothetical protein
VGGDEGALCTERGACISVEGVGCAVCEREMKLGATTAAPISPPAMSSTVATAGAMGLRELLEPGPEPPGLTVARAFAMESGACVEAVARALSLTASAHGRRATA